MDKYKPAKDELELINQRFAKEPYKSEDELYVFPAMIVDNQLTAYFTRLHPDFLAQCVKDLGNGVVFLVGHDKTKLPMAKSFKGQGVSDGDVIEIFAKFFMQKNLKVNDVNTDDFMKAYLGGTIEDVSIGFFAKRWECSICGNDIRSSDCTHWPGKKYNDKDEEDEKGTLCFAWVKEPGGPKGEALGEVSAVYKGAVPNAKTKKPSEVPQFTISLGEGKNLKEMPLDVPIAMNFSVPFSEEYERGKGRGKGGPRQGDGGAKYCKCPKCGHTIEHKRGKPCAEISCPKCGTKMRGTNKKNSMELLDLTKFFAGEYNEEELRDFELSDENTDAILTQEVSEDEAKRLKELATANSADLSVLFKKYPAYELLHAESEYARWTRAYINSLPDSSFAVIEPAYSKGENKNKNARHLPHHNEKGGGTLNKNLDLPHLRNALARMNQIKPVTNSISAEELRSKASAHLEHHKSALENEKQANEIKELKSKLEIASADNKIAMDKITQLEKDKADLSVKLEIMQKANLKLEPKARDGEEYRKDLIKEILELGVKLHGNNFDKDNYEKILNEPDRSLDDIKKMRNQFWSQLCEKFPTGKHTLGPAGGLKEQEENGIPDEAYKI